MSLLLYWNLTNARAGGENVSHVRMSVSENGLYEVRLESFVGHVHTVYFSVKTNEIYRCNLSEEVNICNLETGLEGQCGVREAS